ncbi:MAG: AmmeMemoRadiSam system protein B [Candidatus Ozemobacter sibiricus]|jgi:AmmeMemoRadiSam system protein B|uniref:MEMO1 family protein OZSIB_0695 n=1 Tax=Candidatus Ozemobacter sibiricus TaxID=2268124 RepID=A0A367ZW56_9BACT|nr:MAG: AmmeMemoRadiSam system protein B [Candidatus Ozemobacter sibiricus]
MIREPVVSGRFYPSSPKELVATMEACESHELGVGTRTIEAQGRLRGLILPHAGYMFSGPVATWGLRRLGAERPRPTRLLLLGPKHTPFGAAAAVSLAEGWRTPLGTVPLDEELRAAVLATGAFRGDDAAHAQEHSLEVQLPFLQWLYGKDAFTILPIAIHYADFAECAALGQALAGVLARPEFADVPILVSSDFSHETPRAAAYRLDSEALDLIERRDAQAFHSLVVTEDRSICGFIPITVALVALQKRPLAVRRLTYATSMDVMPHPRGVGYAAVVMEEVAANA